MKGGFFNSPEFKKMAEEILRQRQIAREKRWRELWSKAPKQ